MTRLAQGLVIQRRVIGALMMRELSTRFGRENIGFLWMVAEPLLFALLVGLIWRFMKGPAEHGLSVIGFVASGYLPLVMFRQTVNRSVGLFAANASLMVHRQIRIADFILVRFLIELIGHMTAALVVGVVLVALGELPVPADMGALLLGWWAYGLFTLAAAALLAPLSEMSGILEKLMPVTTYVMIPFSGTFSMMRWLTPSAQDVLWWSPPAQAMELIRGGIWGEPVAVNAVALVAPAMGLLLLGLALCRHVRAVMVVE
jgi:capsular polysaccharide transport system permease protein